MVAVNIINDLPAGNLRPISLSGRFQRCWTSCDGSTLRAVSAPLVAGLLLLRAPFPGSPPLQETARLLEKGTLVSGCFQVLLTWVIQKKVQGKVCIGTGNGAVKIGGTIVAEAV